MKTSNRKIDMIELMKELSVYSYLVFFSLYCDMPNYGNYRVYSDEYFKGLIPELKHESPENYTCILQDMIIRELVNNGCLHRLNDQNGEETNVFIVPKYGSGMANSLSELSFQLPQDAIETSSIREFKRIIIVKIE